VKFLLLDSKASSPQPINEKETYLPASDLSVLLHECIETKKVAAAATEKTVNLLFDNLSDIMLRCGFKRTREFTRLLLKEFSSPKTRVLFLFNPGAHDQEISSSIRGLFHINLAYPKGGEKGETP
jgi:AraC-like DNA-binding protein